MITLPDIVIRYYTALDLPVSTLTLTRGWGTETQRVGLLDTHTGNGYNISGAEVAQSVEQRTENPRVPSSILGLGT